MNDSREMFIEGKIISVVKRLLAGRGNEILGEYDFALPEIEFSAYVGAGIVCPLVVLSACERTEKERLILLDAYALTISFILPETPESEMHCYTYAAAVKRMVLENPTLGGIVDRAVITGCTYIPPKKAYCGGGWEVVVTLRVMSEQ